MNITPQNNRYQVSFKEKDEETGIILPIEQRKLEQYMEVEIIGSSIRESFFMPVKAIIESNMLEVVEVDNEKIYFVPRNAVVCLKGAQFMDYYTPFMPLTGSNEMWF